MPLKVIFEFQLLPGYLPDLLTKKFQEMDFAITQPIFMLRQNGNDIWNQGLIFQRLIS